VIILDAPPNARAYRASPLGDDDATVLSGDVVVMAREHFDDLVARVALQGAAEHLGRPD
jgi:hypothetical protein